MTVGIIDDWRFKTQATRVADELEGALPKNITADDWTQADKDRQRAVVVIRLLLRRIDNLQKGDSLPVRAAKRVGNVVGVAIGFGLVILAVLLTAAAIQWAWGLL